MKKKLLTIGQVAQYFGIRTSALRYYEEIGLLTATERHSGHRYYGEAALQRLALIQLFQDTGLLSLEEIAQMLAGPTGSKDWRHIFQEHIALLEQRIRTAQEAKNYLEYMLNCPRHNILDGCPVLQKELQRRLAQTPAAEVFAVNSCGGDMEESVPCRCSGTALDETEISRDTSE